MDNDLTNLNIEWIKALRKEIAFSIIHNTYQPQKGKTFRMAPNKETVLAKLWDWAKHTSSLPFDNRTSASLICHLRKDVQRIVHAFKTDFPELRIKEYHGKSDPVEKAYDFSNVEESWMDIDLVAYTKTNARTNQMLFRMRYIKDYLCHIEQRSSNVPITEKGLFQWLLNAKRIVISIIELIPKPKDNTISLFQTVKVSSSIIKAEEISDISNARIIDHEIAEVLENKPKKTLEKMRSLDRHHIVECYEILPESLTEEFISKYGNYNHMKWFRAYRQLRDAGINNEMAVEAITRKDYREDRLTTSTRAERYRICLELLKTCTPARNIDDRSRYKADDVKTHLNSPESISYLQNLVPKMARVFDNSDTSRRAKKSGLKTDRAKLGLLNSALQATYGLKFKATNKKLTQYHLVGSFENKDAPKLPSYQTEEEVYWNNGEDARYAYSKLTSDELLLEKLSKISSGKVNTVQITEDIQDLFDMC
ncbi:hypothetical protein C1646_776908 [Rhizophagus diaphanus]|nr:hypothetical protein C1646_776908 [Rhizophagus diaphanus] [Rhizophagus sp. MUCL 43196]